MDCRLYLPENNTLRHVIIAISENMKIVDRDGNEMDKPFGHNRDKQWRNLTQRRYHFFLSWSYPPWLGLGPVSEYTDTSKNTNATYINRKCYALVVSQLA